MEWVETTGRTIEEAKDAALDQLGVDEQDAEFEVLEEPRSGLFGRLRTEARVRARVRPTAPRAKVDRRDRRRRAGGGTDGGTRAKGPRPAPTAADESGPSPRRGAVAVDESVQKGPSREEVADSLRDFLEGLLDAFDLDGQVRTELSADDGAVEAAIDGDGLGLLIGPSGRTLAAVQELARSAVDHGPDTRLRVDIGGYRHRRAAALERFVRSIAEQVLASGTATSLEPMGAADRKVVHDTVNTIPGIRTTSEGEEPRRRVVISPE